MFKLKIIINFKPNSKHKDIIMIIVPLKEVIVYKHKEAERR